MQVLITGATGFVGTRLVQQLIQQGHTPVALSRSREKAEKQLPDECRILQWDPESDKTFNFETDEFSSIEAAVNLAGENISEKRWSDKQKEKIEKSRINVTRSFVSAINQYSPQCHVLVSASAIGYYPVNQSEDLMEDTGPGKGFLPEVCKRWENEAQKLSNDKRLVITRIGVVLGPEGGALGKLMPLCNLGLGGKVGNGQQMMSWIHVDDLVQVLIRAITDENMQGVYNAVSPYPVNNQTFTKSLAKALGRPALFPVPAIALKIMMGEMGTIVLDSQMVSSKKLQKMGFDFKFSKIDQAMEDLAKQFHQQG